MAENKSMDMSRTELSNDAQTDVAGGEAIGGGVNVVKCRFCESLFASEELRDIHEKNKHNFQSSGNGIMGNVINSLKNAAGK